MRLGGALDDQFDKDAIESYVEIPAKIGFFKRLKLEREGKELPKERVYLPLEASATIVRPLLGFIFLAFGVIICIVFYGLLLGSDSFSAHASIGERIWVSLLALISLPISLSAVWVGIMLCRDFFLPGPLLIIEKNGFRYASLSAALIPWSDIAFYGWMSSKGSIFGIQFFLRNIVPDDRRWLHKRIERTTSRKRWGATSAAVIICGLSSSKRALIKVIEQLALQHGAKHSSARDNPN